ncbi:MAG: hypothetical protein RR632_07210, partial [Christensenella sp.]
MEQTTTEKLMERLRSADSFDDFLTDAQEKQSVPDGKEYFDYLFSSRDTVKADIIKKSQLDQYYAYQIFRGEKTPSRDKALLLAFAFAMDVKDAQMLLYICHCEKLYIKNKRDS